MAKVYLRNLNKSNDLPEKTIKLFIARKPINNMEKYNLKHELGLAPSSSLLYRYKKGFITWEGYEKEFNEQLDHSELILRKIKTFVDKDINIALICYCGDFIHCHRRLIGERLLKMGIKVEMG